jgi:hypothetical protein
MAGDTELAKKIGDSVKKDLEQQIKYYNGLPASKAETMSDERRIAEDYLKNYNQLQSVYNPSIQIPGKTMAPADSGKAADTGKK